MSRLLRVLVVEDCERDVLLLEAALKRGGFEPTVERVRNAAALRTALDRQAWDMVVSDSSLPQLDARASLDIVKQTGRSIPFFVVSGVIKEEEAAAIRQAGASAYIAKSQLAELIPCIERILPERQLRPEPLTRAATPPDFKLLFESGPGLYLVLTAELRIAAVSDAYLRATMTRREEILGRGLFEVFPDNPGDPDATGVRNLRTSLERVLQTRAPDTMAVQKYDIRRPESEGGGFEVRFWSPVNSPVAGPHGDVAYIIHRVEDVTEFVLLKERGVRQHQQMEYEVYVRAQEVQEANRKLQSANEELGRLIERTQELDQLKTRFFANVSHELRTPLALIIGPTEKCLAGSDLGADARRDLNVVLRNARTLLKHVNDLLDVAKLEAGQMHASYAETDLAALVRFIAGHFDALAQEKCVDFAVETAASLPVQIDPDKVHRVVLNLLSNAFKFTPPQGQVRCSLKEDPARGRVILEVADSGPGIPAHLREATFERFRQLDGGATRRFGGTGLGLAIAQEFVELHQGTIGIGDAPEGGALFTVELPRRAPEGTSVRPAADSSPPPHDVVRQSVEELHGVKQADTEPMGPEDRPRILVVEDNVEMNQFIRGILACDYRVEAAFNGREGLAKATRMRPDLILTDLMMPEMSGDLLVNALRAHPDLDSTPIVLLSAKADDELRVKLLRTGAQDYVTKPVSAEELRARVSNLVSARQANENNLRLNQQLTQANGQLQRASSELSVLNRELEAFSYSVAHDLRAPLRAIDGLCRILREELTEQLDADTSRQFQLIVSAAQEMDQMIAALLDLSRVSLGAMKRETVELSQLAKAIAGGLRDTDPARKVEFVIEPDLVASGDPRLLRVLLINLLGNAWKYSRNRPHARIEFGSKQDGEARSYYVRDNGAGFDMTYASKLFGVFQRLHLDDEFEGTGIGLATVQRIVHRHGGRVWAEAQVDKGATFYFTIPG
jgi:signal transduction histidine kinase